MTGVHFAAGPCCFCGVVFTFDPAKVPAVPVDSTGHVTPAGVKRPICKHCMRRINEFREAMGEDPIEILSGAYEVVEGLPE